jgi:hypothetical protein
VPPAHTRVNSQGIVTKPRILLHSSMEATTSLSTYLNKFLAVSISTMWTRMRTIWRGIVRGVWLRMAEVVILPGDSHETSYPPPQQHGGYHQPQHVPQQSYGYQHPGRIHVDPDANHMAGHREGRVAADGRSGHFAVQYQSQQPGDSHETSYPPPQQHGGYHQPQHVPQQRPYPCGPGCEPYGGAS